MNTYTLLTTALNFFMIFTIVCMENDEMITFLNQIPVVLENSHNRHSIVSINDNTDEVTMRMLNTGDICTWDMNTGKLKHSEKVPDHAIPFSLRTIIYGNRMAQLSQEDRSICVLDINTGEILFKFTEPKSLVHVAMNNKILVTVTGLSRFSTDIHVKDMNTNADVLRFKTKTAVKSIVLDDNNAIILGLCDGEVHIYDACKGSLLKTLTIKNNPHSDSSDVQAVSVHGTMLAACTSTMLKVWKNKDIDEALTIQTTGCSGDRGILLAVGNHFAVSSLWDNNAQVMRLAPNLDGTPENNPLLWIQKKANSTQFDLIKRAYEATIAQKQLVVTFPENSEIVSVNESQEQKDGRVYPTIALAVRKYLCDRLNIRIY
jgi:WD40 repeat protein